MKQTEDQKIRDQAYRLYYPNRNRRAVNLLGKGLALPFHFCPQCEADVPLVAQSCLFCWKILIPREVNFAENQQVRDSAFTPLYMCRSIGRNHAYMKWSRTPDGHWNEEQRQAYFDGYDECKGK